MERNVVEDRTLRKIGIMGGTFNPVHVGHLMLAEWAREAADLDQVIFIPTGIPYMKEGEQILDGYERLKMVELAIAGHPNFGVSGMELERGGYTYTCDTMKQLKEKYAEDELYFIMGADCLFTIEKWKNPQQIFDNCIVIAAARNGSPIQEMERKCQELELCYHARLKLLKFLSMELSSTEIRRRAAAGESIRYLVPEAVREYIQENRLYRQE